MQTADLAAPNRKQQKKTAEEWQKIEWRSETQMINGLKIQSRPIHILFIYKSGD